MPLRKEADDTVIIIAARMTTLGIAAIHCDELQGVRSETCSRQGVRMVELQQGEQRQIYNQQQPSGGLMQAMCHETMRYQM